MALSQVWHNKNRKGLIIIKGICYIVGSCKDDSTDILFHPTKDDIVIAADGGYDILKEKNIIPDIILGDMDSVEKMPDNENIIKHPAEKDDTDTFLAYKYAFENNYRNFVIFGGLGGRIDHTLANISTLLDISLNGGRAFLLGMGAVLTVITDSSIRFDEKHIGVISVFPQGKTAENVTIKGLKYCVNDVSVMPNLTLGVSNEFIGKRAEISVKNGSLLVIWNECTNDFFENLNSYLL